LLIGRTEDGREFSLAVRGRNVLIVGETNSGKSWLAGLLCERLILHGYSLCVIDPEGDYRTLDALPGVTVLGGEEPPPSPRALLHALRYPDRSVVIDLSSLEHQAKFEYIRSVLPALNVMRRRTGTPHRIVIDEGHYFEAEWLKLVAQMVDPETNSLLVLYDDAQSINRSKSRLRFSFAEVGIQARGRTTVLKLNYRKTAEVMGVACRFAREVLSPKEAEEDGIPLLMPESAGRHGELPRLARLANVQSELDFIVEQARELHGHGLAWRDIAVLFRVNRDGERIAEYLAKARIPVNLFGKSAEHRRFRPADDSAAVSISEKISGRLRWS